MKYIEVDDELYRYIASKTERIGESASDILRRLLGLTVEQPVVKTPEAISQPSHDVARFVHSAFIKTKKLKFDSLISDTELEHQRGAVGRFLYILEMIYKATPDTFEQVLQIQGRDRLYFAKSKDALLEASKSANPKEIGQSGFWVTTNNNTAKKRNILVEVLEQFGANTSTAIEVAQRALPVPVVE